MTDLLILSSDTGEGHNSAAAAVENAARSAGLTTKIRKPLEESTALNRSLADVYNILLTYRPQWVGWYFRVLECARPNDREYLYSRVRRYIGRFIETEGFAALLSVHPMLNHLIQRFIKEEGLRIPCYTLVTDPFPPFWQAWASPYVDRYFVPTAEALQALTAFGIPAWRIERVSMPVRPQFLPSSMSEIQEFRKILKLDGASTILINGGARGGGPVLRTYEVIRSCAQKSNILVVCGRNRRLRRQIESLQHSRTRSFGFLEDIHRYVGASDLVVTKPGALSTFEALACGVPVLLAGIRGLMPQESGLFEAARHYDFGFAARTFRDLESIIKEGPAAWGRKRESLGQFYQFSSGRELIQKIQPEHVPA
jgi:processive 1,2-diacylglycerol beta-glucosyltransferase